jgi:plasmid stabilization system protein ParE
MSPRLILRRLAETDIADAADWYDSEQPDLAARFLSDIDQAFARIRERPLQFPVVSGDVRRALMHTFPYAIYFQISNEFVTVLAVLHLRRDPSELRARVRPSGAP